MGEGERKGRKKRLVSHHGNLTAGLSGIIHTSVLGASSGVAKAGPGWAPAQPMLSIQQVPDQYQ